MASVEVASASQGFAIMVSWDSVTLNAKITFTEVESEISNVMGAFLPTLLRRSTYRGAFKPSPVPSVFKSSSVSICGSSSISGVFKDFLVSSQAYLWWQHQASLSFFEEVNFFSSKTIVEERGIRSQDLGVSLVDQLVLWLFSYIPWVPWLLIRIPLLQRMLTRFSKRDIQNSHFVLISASSVAPQNIYESGRLAMRVWLELEAAHYRVQPISMSSLTVVDALAGALPADTHKKFNKLFFESGPIVLRTQFNLPKNQIPIWLLRFGRV